MGKREIDTLPRTRRKDTKVAGESGTTERRDFGVLFCVVNEINNNRKGWWCFGKLIGLHVSREGREEKKGVEFVYIYIKKRGNMWGFFSPLYPLRRVVGAFLVEVPVLEPMAICSGFLPASAAWGAVVGDLQ